MGEVKAEGSREMVAGSVGEVVKDDGLPKFSLDGINLPGCLEIRDRLMNLEGMPDRAVVILSLRAFGLSLGHIARICKCKQTTVADYIKRYDPQGVCRISIEDRRAITSQMLMGSAVGALLEITPAKLRDADAGELAGIATKCVLTAEKIRELDKGDGKRAGRLEAAMSYLDMEEDEQD